MFCPEVIFTLPRKKIISKTFKRTHCSTTPLIEQAQHQQYTHKNNTLVEEIISKTPKILFISFYLLYKWLLRLCFICDWRTITIHNNCFNYLKVLILQLSIWHSHSLFHRMSFLHSHFPDPYIVRFVLDSRFMFTLMQVLLSVHALNGSTLEWWMDRELIKGRILGRRVPNIFWKKYFGISIFF